MADMESLYCDYYRFIYKFLLNMCRDESLAEELTAETFFRAYINLKKLKNEEKAPYWLCSIGKNLYFSHLKKSSRFSELPENAVDNSDVTQTVISKMLSEDAIKHIRRLEEPYREVFILSVFGELSMKEISELYGKSESWARVTFYRAKQKIAERMGRKDEM